MKRRLFKLALLLLLGAVINIAVAWGCALLSDDSAGEWRNAVAHPHGLHWSIERSDTAVKSSCKSKLWTGFAGRYMTTDQIDDLRPPWGRIRDPDVPEPTVHWNSMEGKRWTESKSGFMCFVDVAAGWPCLSVWHGWGTTEIVEQPLAQPFSVHVGGISLKRPNVIGTDGVGLPLLPVFPGFAINTLLYAAICWLVFFAPFVLRRRLRRRRGLCPVCAYPIGSSEVCTECGEALRTKSEPS